MCKRTLAFLSRFLGASVCTIALAAAPLSPAGAGKTPQSVPHAAKFHKQDNAAFADLAQAIDKILDTPSLRAGFQGVVVQSLKDNTVWYQRNADHVFMPASNTKLLTSGAALATLGPDFTYHTRLVRTGPISDDGVLQGDLILCGAGDPLLSLQDLAELAAAARKAGIQRIAGNVCYDASLFDTQGLGDGWEWDDESFYYAAQISALNINENYVNVRAIPGKSASDPVQVLLMPQTDYVAVVNHGTTGAEKTDLTLDIERARGKNIVVLNGVLPLDYAKGVGHNENITIEEPPRFAAVLFQQALKKAGVATEGDVRESSPVPAGAMLVAEHVSPPLSELLTKMNKPSDNLMAECLLKTVGAKVKNRGTGGSEGTAVQSARAWLLKIGMDADGLHQVDGSGLSRHNFVSPRNFVRLLAYLHSQPYFPAFYDSLPIAGVDGSLRLRLKGTPAEKNCHAKTGTFAASSCLTGYVTTKDGELLAFSLLMNNHLTSSRPCTDAQDKIVALLANYSRSH